MSYIGIALAAFVVIVLLGAIYQGVGIRLDSRRFPPPGRLVQVGDNRVHLYELGSGSPAVILESGISASSLNWRRVQTEVAKFTRVCSYDRAGLGWSELCDSPCTPSSLAAQLECLLCAAEVPGPYILVGHSFGGLIVQAFARRYPQLTAGVVLVDPLDPAEWTPLTDEQRRIIRHGIALSRRGALAARLGVVRICLNLLLAGNRLLPRLAAKGWSGRASEVTDRIAGQVQKMPQETWPWVAAHWTQPKCFEAMARHFECLADSIREMANASGIDAPAILLSGKLNEHPADPRHYAQRVSSQAKFVEAERSGHWIQLDQPELVVNSTQELVERVRAAAAEKTTSSGRQPT